MQELEPRLCNPATCPNIQLVDGRRVHCERLGGNHMHFSREKKYRIPENLIRYHCGFPDPDVVRCVTETYEGEPCDLSSLVLVSLGWDKQYS